MVRIRRQVFWFSQIFSNWFAMRNLISRMKNKWIIRCTISTAVFMGLYIFLISSSREYISTSILAKEFSRKLENLPKCSGEAACNKLYDSNISSRVNLASSSPEYRTMRSELFSKDSRNLLDSTWKPDCKGVDDLGSSVHTLILCDIQQENSSLLFHAFSLENKIIAKITLGNILLVADAFYGLEIECQVVSGPFFFLQVKDQMSQQIIPLSRGFDHICSEKILFLYFRCPFRYLLSVSPFPVLYGVGLGYDEDPLFQSERCNTCASRNFSGDRDP